MAEIREALAPQLPIPVLRRLFERARDDSWIAFGSRRPTRAGDVAPHWLYTVQKGELERWLPPILEYEVGNTQYVAQNTMSASALRWSLRSNAPPRDPEDYRQAIRDGNPIAYQKWGKHARELAGLVLDLDCYKAQLSPEITLGLVLDMVRQQGTLPQPSFAALSGRGVYLWWLLRAADGKAPLNTVENRHMWTLVLDELCRRTRNLESDPGAKQVLQWFKRPGTVDTKTGNQVLYMTFGTGPMAAVPEYLLTDLVDGLGLSLAPAPSESAIPLLEAPAVEPVNVTARAANRWQPGMAGNPHASHRSRVRDLEQLASYRGGIQKGHRHQALVCFYRCRLATYGGAKAGPGVVAQAKAETQDFNAQWCNPPKAPDQVAKVFKSWRGIYRPRRAWLINRLGVTDDESRALDLDALCTDAVLTEREHDKCVAKMAVTDTKAEIDKLLLPPHRLSTRDVMKVTGTTRGMVMRRRKRLVEAGKLTGRDDRGSAPGQTKLDV